MSPSPSPHGFSWRPGYRRSRAEFREIQCPATPSRQASAPQFAATSWWRESRPANGLPAPTCPPKPRLAEDYGRWRWAPCARPCSTSRPKACAAPAGQGDGGREPRQRPGAVSLLQPAPARRNHAAPPKAACSPGCGKAATGEERGRARARGRRGHPPYHTACARATARQSSTNTSSSMPRRFGALETAPDPLPNTLYQLYQSAVRRDGSPGLRGGDRRRHVGGLRAGARAAARNADPADPAHRPRLQRLPHRVEDFLGEHGRPAITRPISRPLPRRGP